MGRRINIAFDLSFEKKQFVQLKRGRSDIMSKGVKTMRAIPIETAYLS